MNTLIRRSFSFFCRKVFRSTHSLHFRIKFYNLTAKQQNTVINRGKTSIRMLWNQYCLLKELEELKRIPEFENAMSYALRQNYDLSKVYFLRLIEILNNQESINPGIILLVLKKCFTFKAFFFKFVFFFFQGIQLCCEYWKIMKNWVKF